MIESLEERAASARQSINDATSSVIERDFDPPRQHVGAMGAAVFAVILAVGGVLAIARSDGPPDTTAGAPGPVESGAFLVFDDPPAEFESMIFTEWSVDPEGIPAFDVYGTPGDAPFAEGDLLVGWITVPVGESLVDPDTPTVEFNGETIFIESDESFSVISWVDGENGVGLLSQSLDEDQLLERMKTYIETGEIDAGGLALLDQGAEILFPQAGGSSVVVYQLPDPQDIFPGKINAIVVDSAPVDNSLLLRWFRRASPDGPLPIEPAEIVEYNGWTIEADVSIENSLQLRFEVDGVPVHITMLTRDMSTTPSIEDALALLGDIRSATAAEIEEMTRRGDETKTVIPFAD